MADTSLPRFLVGLVFVAVLVGPLWFGGSCLRRRLLPTSLPQTEGRLCDAVLTLSALILCSELLGTVGLLKLVPLLITCILAGLAMVFAAQRLPVHVGAQPSAASHAPGDHAIDRRWLTTLALGCAGVVAAGWLAVTIVAMEKGLPTGIDTWWYHMPLAAQFAQSGNVTDLHRVAAEPLVAFYPDSSSLLHAVGILAMSRDTLSPMVNFGWFLLAIGAAWAITRELRVGAGGVIAICVICAAPVIRGTQAGEALNDVAILACTLVSLALALTSHGDRRVLAVSGLAMGLAVGMKLNVIAMAAAIGFAIPWLAGNSDLRSRSGRRAALASIGIWVGGTALTGGFWYLQDVFTAGSPYPFVDLPFGLHAPDSVFNNPPISDTFLDYLGDGKVSHLTGGLAHAFGSLWPLVIGASFAGIVLGLRLGGRARALALLAAFGVLLYSVTPTTGPFSADALRYLAPSLTISLILFFLSVERIAPRLSPAVCIASAAFLLYELHAPIPRAVALASASTALAAFAIGSCVALAYFVVRNPSRGKLAVAVIALAVLMVGAIRWHDRGGFLGPGYAQAGSFGAVGGAEGDVAPAFEAARGISDSRVGVDGTVLQYPLYGTNLSNSVQYIGVEGPDNAYSEARSCEEWVTALARGKFDYVLIAPFAAIANPAAKIRWTAAAPLNRVLFRDGRIALIRLGERPDARSCRAPHRAGE